MTEKPDIKMTEKPDIKITAKPDIKIAAKPDIKITSKPDFKDKLLHNWKFWVIFCKIDANNNQQYQIEPIITVGRVELFCDYFSSLPPISEIKYDPSNRVSIGFFDEPIPPAWEDPGNQNGGMFTFLIGDLKPYEKINEVWRCLLIDTARGKLDYILKQGDVKNKEKDTNEDKLITSKSKEQKVTVKDRYVRGIVIVLRSNMQYKIEIWTKENYKNSPLVFQNLEKYLIKSLNKVCKLNLESLSLQFRPHNN